MGSVKDLEIIKKPRKDMMGIGRFHFSDRYSVFDWGAMPDRIEHKGSALCMMGAYCFEKLLSRDINTHYRGLVNQDDELVRLKELDQPTNIMELDLVNVIRPQARVEHGSLRYDYSMFTTELSNYLIPLEVVYRNGLPEGSSVFKRLERGSTTIEELGLDHHPTPGEWLSKPIFDVSTKLEEKDRYVSWKEAERIAGLIDQEVKDVKSVLLEVDNVITDVAANAGFKNEDGKIELAFNPQRRLMVVDVIGTLDECRFTYGGLHVSKELARKFYRRTDWYTAVEKAKIRAEEEGVKDWRRLCPHSPPRLDPTLRNIISEIYMAAANRLTSQELFDVSDFDEAMRKYGSYKSGD
ncbi:phosphoribosylaminoimidazolesuccinocarboxamide synthase [Candidatus Bathyarchaeota archaeon]|nr:phosphoribosylaminoimidazolesuccinocarboxamide synthase [Candidatus Bathyarchaeota archaeon]